MDTIKDVFLCVAAGIALALASFFFFCGTCSLKYPGSTSGPRGENELPSVLLFVGATGGVAGLAVSTTRRILRRNTGSASRK
jgi:hypothetical protein